MAFEIIEDLEIKSVSDIITFVKQNSLRKYHIRSNSMSFYRGQSDYSWHLQPSVYRDNQFQYEATYTKELERIRPFEFNGCNSFDKLVKMQHYGLPTRLLDVTTNPLVALYFSCRSKHDRDGAFFFFSSPTFWSDNHAVEIVADYAVSHKDMHEIPENVRKDVLSILSIPAHAVLPKISNQRINQQSGAFLIFGMSRCMPRENENPNFVRFRDLDKSEEERICPVIKKIKIPSMYKREIIKELDIININEGFLFPELEYQSKSIIKHIRDE